MNCEHKRKPKQAAHTEQVPHFLLAKNETVGLHVVRVVVEDLFHSDVYGSKCKLLEKPMAVLVKIPSWDKLRRVSPTPTRTKMVIGES